MPTRFIFREATRRRLPAVLRRVPVALRPLPLRLYLRVYFFLTFDPFAHFLAAALNFARHADLPLVFLPFNCVFMHF